MKINLTLPIPAAFAVLLAAVLVAAPALADHDVATKSAKKEGFSFEYPADWTFQDLGSDDFGGMTGYTLALGAPDGLEIAVVVMVFPDFSLDLGQSGMTFKDFLKLVLENFLGEELAKTNIEAAECEFAHGTVTGFLADAGKGMISKGASICGDKKGKAAAIVIVSFDVDQEKDDGVAEAFDMTVLIENSLTFPK